MNEYKSHSIGYDSAIKLANSNWWKDLSYIDIAKFQLLTDELCCPFDIFHEAITKALDRPVYTHEFASNWIGLVREIFGEAPPPSLEEVFNLIPEEKRALMFTKESS